MTPTLDSTRPASRRRGAALLAAAVLGSALLGGTLPAAQAAPETIYVDQENVPSGFTGQWKPATSSLIAQPFAPNSTGAAANISVTMSETDENTVTSAALHAFPFDGEIDDAPLTGGTAVLSYSEPDPSGQLTLTATFPERPVLTAGVRYALVIDPYAPGEDAATFPHSLENAGGPTAPFFAWEKDYDIWKGHATGRLFFTLRMVEAPPAPQEVTPTEPSFVPGECGEPGRVSLPQQDGVLFTTQVNDAQVMTVTAAPAEGFVFPAGVVATWEYDLAPTSCTGSESDADADTDGSESNAAATADGSDADASAGIDADATADASGADSAADGSTGAGGAGTSGDDTATTSATAASDGATADSGGTPAEPALPSTGAEVGALAAVAAGALLLGALLLRHRRRTES